MRVLLATMFALAACGGTKPAPPATRSPVLSQDRAPGNTPIDANAKYEELATRACACRSQKDVACARQVVREMVAFMIDHTNAPGDATRANDAGDRIGKCVIEAGLPAQELTDELKKVPPPKES